MKGRGKGPGGKEINRMYFNASKSDPAPVCILNNNAIRAMFDKVSGKHEFDGGLDELIEELRFYITAHEAAGIEFDTVLQQIDFGFGLVLLLHKEGGLWIIRAFLTIGEVIKYTAIRVWKKLVNGARSVLARVFSGWQMLTTHRAPLLD